MTEEAKVYPPAPRQCEWCRFWDNSMQSGHPSKELDVTGACRRAPPGFDSRTSLAVWPYTDFNDWCGEFSADKERWEDHCTTLDNDLPF